MLFSEIVPSFSSHEIAKHVLFHLLYQVMPQEKNFGMCQNPFVVVFVILVALATFSFSIVVAFAFLVTLSTLLLCLFADERLIIAIDTEGVRGELCDNIGVLMMAKCVGAIVDLKRIRASAMKRTYGEE